MLKFLETYLQIEMDIVKALPIRSGDYFLEVLSQEQSIQLNMLHLVLLEMQLILEI